MYKTKSKNSTVAFKLNCNDYFCKKIVVIIFYDKVYSKRIFYNKVSLK